jgi:hypothetical protein
MTVSRSEVMWAYVTEHGADLAHLWVRKGSRGLEVLDVMVDREAGIVPTRKDIVGDVHGVAFEEPAPASSMGRDSCLRPSGRLSARLSQAVTRWDSMKIRSVGLPISSERACQKGEGDA